MPKHDEKFCKYCEGFFPLINDELAAWHETGRCKRKTIDVRISLEPLPGYPAMIEQFFDVQRSEVIPTKALEGYRIREVFSDSIGRLVVTYEKIGEEF